AATDHVMLLIPKRSVAAYSVSVDTILGAFRERRRPARFSVWFYDGDRALAEEALLWAEASEVDLVMTVGSDATALLSEIYRGPGLIPVVTSASKDPVLMGQTPAHDRGSGDNFAFTSINLNVETLVPMLREVFPELSRIWVLYARKNVSAVETQLRPLIDYAAAHPEQGLTIGEIAVENYEEAPEDLARLMPAATAEIEASDPERRRSVFWITGSTSVYDHIGLIDRLAGGAPVLAALPDVVRPGSESAALSIGVNQSSAVHLAALYALRILSGDAAPGDLPVGQVSPPDIAINFLKVEELGLTLPFSFFEDATFIYDRSGAPARAFGQSVRLD
ncbi:MAG: ABC transporter substrate binding protein, partial [Pseudomonadota bacterium]